MQMEFYITQPLTGPTSMSLCKSAMFISHDSHQFHVPPALTDDKSQHWRLMEVALRCPWFVITVVEHHQTAELSLLRTWCVAWAQDLLRILEDRQDVEVRALACMRPVHDSSPRTWSATDVHEVWLLVNDDGTFVTFYDGAGKEIYREPTLRESALGGGRLLVLKLGGTRANWSSE